MNWTSVIDCEVLFYNSAIDELYTVFASPEFMTAIILANFTNENNHYVGVVNENE